MDRDSRSTFADTATCVHTLSIVDSIIMIARRARSIKTTPSPRVAGVAMNRRPGKNDSPSPPLLERPGDNCRPKTNKNYAMPHFQVVRPSGLQYPRGHPTRKRWGRKKTTIHPPPKKKSTSIGRVVICGESEGFFSSLLPELGARFNQPRCWHGARKRRRRLVGCQRERAATANSSDPFST